MAITLNGSSGVTTNTTPLAQDLTVSGSYYINNAVYDTGWTYDLSNASVAHHIGTNTSAPVRIRSNNTDGIIVDSAGRVTMPYQPAVQVDGALHSGLNYIGNDVRTNVGGHFNASTGVFTAPVSGTYLVSYYITPSDTNSHFLDIYVNSTKVGNNHLQYSSQYQAATNIKVLALNANDYVECRRRSDTYGIYGAGLSICLLG